MTVRNFGEPVTQVAGGQSFSNANAVTPSDSVPLAQVAMALYVTVTGNVAFISAGGDTVTLSAVPAFTLIPIAASQVKATGTTATVLALW